MQSIQAENPAEQDRLAALYRYHILDTDAEDEFERLARLASYICGTPISLINLLDLDRQWFKARVGTDLRETPRSFSFCEHTIAGEDIMEVQDAHLDDRFRNNPLVTGETNFRYYAGSPLITEDGHKLGTLCVIDTRPRVLTSEQREALNTLAQEVVARMELRYQKQQLQTENTQLLEDLQARVKEQKKMLKLFTRFVPEEVIRKAMDSTADSMFEAELRYVTVLFCDIRNYTDMAERMEPKEAVSLLNTYYSVMTEVIKQYNGSVNQYVGDEIFATFGAPVSYPDDERNAVVGSPGTELEFAL